METSDDFLPRIQPDSIGRMFFAVGGGRNDRTKEFESDRAYRAFTVVLVRGERAFQRGDGVYVIGNQSAPGVEILRMLKTEAPWQKQPEDLQVAANHLMFSGELDGREWVLSRAYPDPTIDRILRSLRPVLDTVPRETQSR